MGDAPISEILPALIKALSSSSSVIVQAPPGAGKTTVVPLELLKHAALNGKKIVMLEPRRLAATNAARWMASLLGEEVGRTVGYTIRFDRKVSSATRIEVVTEGVLARRLYTDPLLEDTGIVIFDEFHERNLHSDVGLALCFDLQQGLRDDLKMLIMSATIESESLASLLNGAPVICSRGRSFPVSLRYTGDHGYDTMALTVAGTVRQAWRETEGDILVFLPGAREIRAVQRALGAEALHPAPLIVPLYGDMPFAAQEKAILPGTCRKVVLATNIAETSLTIEGIRVVIDSGWVRQLRHDHATGLSRLMTVRVSAASADQRAGRAGRRAPGVCYRLWSEHTQRALVPHAPPEIVTSDLSSLLLDLAAWGVTDPEKLHWLDTPPLAALAAAKGLLVRLGALDVKGAVTPAGIKMGRLPLHPRLAHMLLYGMKKGWSSLAADLGALLSERDIFHSDTAGGRRSTDSDVMDRLESLLHWRRSGEGSGENLDIHACRAVDRAALALCRAAGITRSSYNPAVEQVGILLAAAYPDRLGQKRENSPDSYLLSSGRGASLSARSAVARPSHLVAVAVEDREGGNGAIHTASSVDLAVLKREFPDWFEKRRVVYWDDQQAKPVAREEERVGALVVGTVPVPMLPSETVEALLAAIRSGGLGLLKWSDAALRFRSRVRFLAGHYPGQWPDFSDETLLSTVDSWLAPWLANFKARALATFDVLPPLQGCLTYEQMRKLDEGAPAQLTVPSGSRIYLDYSEEEGPVLAVKLQELFGLASTPMVAWGKVPVVLHLLSPARRPLQVTRDLASFWNSGYQQVRKELKGRYPKHPWPEDPWNAVPTRHITRRK